MFAAGFEHCRKDVFIGLDLIITLTIVVGLYECVCSCTCVYIPPTAVMLVLIVMCNFAEY